MQERLKGYFTKILDKWNTLEKPQQIRLGITIAILLITLSATIFLVTRPKWVVLISNKDEMTIGQYENVLNNEGINTSLKNNSTALAVEEKNVDRARILVASTPELSGVEFSYDDLLAASGMGATESIRKGNFNRLLQTELADTIGSMEGIKDARVYINTPNDDTFLIKSQSEPSASVFLVTSKNIDEEQATTIANFVASSVKDLKPENVQIANHLGESVYSGLEEKAGSAGSKFNIQLQMENKIDAKVRAALYNLYDDIKVMPALSFNWNEQEVTTRTVTSPVDDSQAGLISKEVLESESATNANPDEEPGINANDNATTDYEMGTQMESSAQRKLTQREYQLNEESSHTITSAGDLIGDRSSVAVVANQFRHYYEDYMTKNNLLNGQTWQDFKDTMPRSTLLDVDQSLLNVLRTGTGINDVTLVAYEVPVFHDKVVEPIQPTQIIMFIILALLILLLAFGLIRKAQPDEVTEVEPELSVEDLLVSTQIEEEKEIEQQLEADRLRDIEFSSESEAKRQIEKFIIEKPEAVAQLLRNWLNDEWE